MNKAQVYSTGKYLHISPKKVRIVMDLVRNASVKDAARVLTFNKTKAGALINKVLKSAVASAKTNLNLKEDNLIISDLQVNTGPIQKRGRIVARGRFSPILKRTSHIIVGLSERTK